MQVWRTHFYLNPPTTAKEKKTYGFNSTKPAPNIPELNQFEEELLKLIQSIDFNKTNNPFQRQLSKDGTNIKQNNHILVLADKTTNFYKVEPDMYKQLLDSNINKDYKKAPTIIAKAINKQDKRIATQLELDNRIDITAQKQAFITLKDHKDNFHITPNADSSTQQNQR